jgi:hypothetical protein
VIKHQHHSEFGRLVPHLELLNRGLPAQTDRSTLVDDASNKIFELRLTLACFGFGANVRIDDPVLSSGGTNPDVMFKMSDGRDWGLACKVLYGSNPKTFADRLREGVDQIERSPAKTGFVCVSLRNLLPHDLFLPVTGKDDHGGPILGAYPSLDVLRERASTHVVARVSEMVRSIGLGELAGIFKGKRAVAAVVIPVDVVGLALRDGQPVMSTLSFLHVVEFNLLGLPNLFDDRAARVAGALNHGLALREGD